MILNYNVYCTANIIIRELSVLSVIVDFFRAFYNSCNAEMRSRNLIET